MNPYLAVTLAGEELWLLADKAIYYPAERSLLIADAHFGKAAAYRKLGQPVPHGTTQANLRRLDSLLNAYPCDHLIFLGDFLHAPESHAVCTLAALEQWRAEHSTLR
ncbi:metallophosphoesterase, partial [Pseudomonas syringae pv. coryli]